MDAFPIDTHVKQLLDKYYSCLLYTSQDLWELIVTFMISQNNNIKRITNSVDLLCRRCGHKIDGSAEGKELYTFPKPLELSLIHI